MSKKRSMPKSYSPRSVPKLLTGIHGLDEITDGGIPQGRTTLIAGNPGAGKTLLAAEFLYHGAADHNEPGLFVSFEESKDELIANVASLGFDLKKLIAQKKLCINHIHIDSSEFEEIGIYNLDGIFIQLDYLVKKMKIKRIAIDTLEVLFSNFADQSILRTELQRLFRWLKDNKLTAIVTAESGIKSLTRHGIEEYVADCVIALDNRIEQQVSTRRLRIVKYRGSNHGGNEYPFLISKTGISVLPITSLNLIYKASSKRISSGVPRLDTMLGGKGFYRGASILLSGVAGTGKSSFAAAFAHSVCKSGEKCIYFAFEESVSQIIRNMKSIGMDLTQWIKKDLLEIHATQPYSAGLESHLVGMHDLIMKFKPRAVIIDPISNLKEIGNQKEVKALFARLVDYLKGNNITIFSTSLLTDSRYRQPNMDSVSSLMDAWILLNNIEYEGELNRTLMILKSRGMRHSTQVREIILSNDGIKLEDVYVDSGKVFAGSARVAQEAQHQVKKMFRNADIKRKNRRLLNKRKDIKSKISALESILESDTDDLAISKLQANLINKINDQALDEISLIRMSDQITNGKKKKRGS